MFSSSRILAMAMTVIMTPDFRMHTCSKFMPTLRGCNSHHQKIIWAIFPQGTFTRSLQHLSTKRNLQLTTMLVLNSALILNKMIGTGIFVTPATILTITGSKGDSIVLWIIGGLVTWFG